MKRKVFTLFIGLLFISSCENDSILLETESIDTNLTTLPGETAKNGNSKIVVCHKGKLINVSINSLSAHQGHGDAVDMDGDGYFNMANSCGQTDCDDNNSSVNPQMAEICGDGIDNNCDGKIDEGCENGSQSSPFLSLNKAWIVPTDGYYWFKINNTTFNTFVEAGSGWILIASGLGSTTEAIYQTTLNLKLQSDQILPSNVYNSTEIKNVRIEGTAGLYLPFDVKSSNATVLENLYANRTLSVGNNGESWTGIGESRMVKECDGENKTLNKAIYHACLNYVGLHWLAETGQEYVYFASGEAHGAVNNLNLWIATNR